MKTINQSKPINDSIISEFERIFHIQLPQDYKEFILKNNGGRPEDDWGFDFAEVGGTASTSSVICDFLAINSDSGKTFDDLGKTYRMLVEEKQIPPRLLPFASDPGGNYICISVVAGEDYSKVYFCNHEWEDPKTGFMILSPIADSFTEFIEKCYICEDE